MRSPSVLLTVTLSLCLAATASADETLSETETTDIVTKLTGQARNTWISAGTIVATHQEYVAAQVTDPAVISAEVQQAIDNFQPNPAWTPEMQKMALDAVPFNVRYKLGNEYTMSSSVTLKYDGSSFYWEINVSSRHDSVTKDASLAGNSMTDEFTLDWNRRRVFIWDGSKYTTYSSGGQATEDTVGKFPRAVKGPLTAGLFPWGIGKFKKNEIAMANVLAKELSLNGSARIDMDITHPDGSTTKAALDPAKGCSVTSATFEDAAGRIVTIACDGYQLVAGGWVPTSISIRKEDRVTGRLLSSDQWTITSIDGAIPAPDSFTMSYPLDTVVESFTPVDSESAIYSYAPTADVDELLAQRLTYAAAAGRQPQNCATAALQNVASSFGKSIPAATLAGMVGPNGQTSLYQMKQAALAAGLYARAVNTDLAALQALEGVKAILYLPGTKHFVILNELDNQCVRLIDLSSKRFYYRQDADVFPTEWPGTALLVSKRPLPGGLAQVPDGLLTSMVGGAYSCTRLVQEAGYTWCDGYPQGCTGKVTVYFERYVCETAASGTCSTSYMLRRMESPCEVPEGGGCTYNPDKWSSFYMPACK
jgi:hypothetical protein